MKRLSNISHTSRHERMRPQRDFAVIVGALLCVGVTACHGCSGNGNGDDSSSSTSETDGTGETETHTSDTISTESVSDSETTTETVTHTTETQTDETETKPTDTKPTDTQTTETATETDTDLPEGCQLLTPATANFSGWTGREAIDNDYVVWMSLLEDGDTTILMSHRLSTGKRVELARHAYPSVIEHPQIRSGQIYYEEDITRGNGDTREIFGMNIDGTNERRLTNNDYSEAIMGGGGNVFMTNHYNDKGFGLSFYDNVDGSLEFSVQDFSAAPCAFDGVRWAVSICTDDDLVYSYDLQKPEQPPQALSPLRAEAVNLSMQSNSPIAVMGIGMEEGGGTEAFDLVMWNVETNERTTLAGGPWDQVMPDIDGHLVAYVDTAPVKKFWHSGNTGELKLIDIETKATRSILPVSIYYGVGLWSHWVAVNNLGKWGDALVLCDLKEMGLVGEDGHVVP